MDVESFGTYPRCSAPIRFAAQPVSVCFKNLTVC